MKYILFVFFLTFQFYYLAFRSKYDLFKRDHFTNKPIPNISGFIIFLNILCIGLIFNYSNDYLILILLFSLSFLYLWDDIKFFHISRSNQIIIKLSIQVIFINFILYYFNLYKFYNFLPFFFLLAFFLFVINTANFIDGLNGFLAVNIFFFLINVFYIQNKLNIIFVNEELLFFFIISVLIFLYFNFFLSGKIFMGDSGSIPFGFLISYIFCKNLIQGYGFINFFLFLYPIIDVMITLFIRLINKKNFFGRLFDYAFFYPVIKYKKSHSYVFIIIVLTNLVNFFFLNMFINTFNFNYILINVFLHLLVFFQFKFIKPL